ncbi:diacylglycerol kinase family protein [Vagococcus bubulae]|uniref:UDP kinase n=1 Tax=Vagococcus bubulae TaxID=1977868 RepID=A0A429ZRQ9_9ENTE|nr:UDP kinase [Vagococcus bubulae]
MIMAWNDKQTEKNRCFFQSLIHALRGLKTVVEEERNMRYHLFLGTSAIVLGFICHISKYEWLWLVCAIVLVLMAEMANTAFEVLVDLVTNKTYHPLAKKIKDMSAGMVLLSAFFALFVGMVIFLPKIIHVWFGN